MKSVGIISEYNPFHNGHKFQIGKVREKYGECTVVSLMSPNFVQRGEPSLFDKYSRGYSAVAGGADLCLCMPTVCVNLSAEGFASSGIYACAKLNLDAVCFGAECDGRDALFEIAEYTLTEEYRTGVKEECQADPSLSLMRAGERHIAKTMGKEYAEIISQPNNILAVEYIKALKKQNYNPEVIIIKREGEGYKSLRESPLPSATFLREKILSPAFSAERFVPQKCGEIYSELARSGKYAESGKFRDILRATLLFKSTNEIEECVGSGELASRIANAVRCAENFDAFISEVTSPRITRARINRTLLSCLFGTSHNEFIHESPAFLQLTAANRRGCEFLAERRRSEFPIIVKNADNEKFSDKRDFKRQWAYECRADEVWAMCRKAPCPPNIFLKQSPYIIRQDF